MSVVKSLAGAVPPTQLPFVPHAVVPAVELQSIVAAWEETMVKSTKARAKPGKNRPWIAENSPLKWSGRISTLYGLAGLVPVMAFTATMFAT